MKDAFKEHLVTRLFTARSSWLTSGTTMPEVISVDSYFLDVLEAVWFSELSNDDFEELLELIKSVEKTLMEGGDASKFINRLSHPGQ
jgi:hypothetical protein